MIRFLPVLIVLSACVPFPVAEPIDIPATIAQLLPPDIDTSEVTRDPEGCYSYIYASSLFTVTDANGDPVCIP